jgi:4-hydroxy-3-methylbut-2-enyl diphosphate reductase
MRSFDIPTYYKSSFISTIKNLRKESDPRKKDFTPTKLDFKSIEFLIARHFGFCYGVENAIEIAYKAVDENPDKNIFLLSQMIHNPIVNKDLQEKGIRFIMDTEGNQLVKWEALTADDVVLIPAFGTTIEIENKLKSIGVKTEGYNTTCPFVERVWKQSKKLGDNNFTNIIHGKYNHEETRATFSHSTKNSPSLIIKDIHEAKIIADIIEGKVGEKEFKSIFKNRFSEGFDINIHLNKIGVINQTTMLATETQEIADFLKSAILKKEGQDQLKQHFADTRDTLCYATNDNQQATLSLLKETADIAIVVGGYNSSNTSHIVELLEEKLPTFFISSAEEIIDATTIHHYDFHSKKMVTTENYLGIANPLKIILTSGASCPDTIVDRVLDKLLDYFPGDVSKEDVVKSLS